MRRRCLAAISLLMTGVFTLAAASAVLFVLLDNSATLRQWSGIEATVQYFALRHTYRPDPALVFTYRTPGPVDSTFVGDLYSADYGISVVPVPVRCALYR